MSVKITMPALSPTMEEGTLAKWCVKEGDAVHNGDVIAEIETDKATMEVEAADEGIMAKILIPAGTAGVKVGSLIAVMAEEGEDAAQVAKSALAANAGGEAALSAHGNGGAAEAVPANAGGRKSADGEAELAQSNSNGAFASPLARRVAAQAGVDLSQIKGSGPHGRIIERDVRQAEAGGGASVSRAAGGRIFASPLARRLAAQAGLDLSQLKGTGPEGRIIERDVRQAEARKGEAASAARSAVADNRQSPSAASAASVPAIDEKAVLRLFKPEEYEIVPHASMRKVIARRLSESKRTIPHFYVTVDCGLDALLRLRSEINAAAPQVKKADLTVPAYKLSVNDMVIKAAALALKYIPDANVSWLEEGMIRHKYVDVGVAVSIPNGLITPIVRHAEEKSLVVISNEMKDLVKRAKQMRLKPEEYQGGTTSVSNMGMFGVKSFSAIVNPPQASIFAIGAGEPRAVVRDGALAIANVMSMTLSVDHRAIDGALAAELAQCFKGIIEKPIAMLI